MKWVKENRKTFILFVAVLAVLYLIYIFVENRDIAAEAFRAGWEKYE